MLIGEVAARSGISARMLRHYDRLGLVTPGERTSGKYREYSEDDVRRLFHVEALRSLGLSLNEIADVLADLSFDPASMVQQLLARTRERLTREQELLRRLDQVEASDPTAWSDVLHIIGLMRQLGANEGASRQRFALTMGGDDDAGAASFAEAALNEAEPNVAGALQWALARGGDRALPILARALDSSDARRRQRAIEALEKIGTPQSIAVLADAHKHHDPLVRRRGAFARAGIGNTDAIPALVAAIVDGDDDVEASDILGSLAHRHDNAAEIAQAIADQLANASAETRRRLTAALAEIPGARAGEILTRLTEDPDQGVAVTATYVLQQRDPDD